MFPFRNTDEMKCLKKFCFSPKNISIFLQNFCVTSRDLFACKICVFTRKLFISSVSSLNAKVLQLNKVSVGNPKHFLENLKALIYNFSSHLIFIHITAGL